MPKTVLRDFYRNPKDCPVSSGSLNQKRDFIRVGVKVPERDPAGKPIVLNRAALEPQNVNKNIRDFGPAFFHEYSNYPPARRRKVIGTIEDVQVLRTLYLRERMPNQKALIANRIKELKPDEPIGDIAQSPS